MVCEIVVAMAAQWMPSPNGPRNSQSRKTLVTDETIRKYSGLRLSPTAFIMPLNVLYITRASEPRK